MKSDLFHGFYLKDLLVDPRKGMITGRTRSVHLSPKAMDVLLCLAAHPGELISREALLSKVWGTGKGSQESPGRAVSEIRHVLGDHPDNPEFIQTLPKRGYRLIVSVKSISEHDTHRESSISLGQDLDELGLFDNLKQRGVIETALAYLVFGWLIIQVVDVLFDQLHMPYWAGTFITTLVLAGFPIAIILSWFLEFRHGRAVLHELSPKDARRKRFSRTYVSVVAALTIAAIFVFIYDHNIGLPEPTAAEVVATAEETVLPPVLDNSIAVLPFYNLDGSDESRIFSEGLVDDVINRLSRVPGLLVSSRGDAFTLEPNSASKKVRERLRVALYVEGSVQMQENHMRIIVQLIDSETGFHVLSRSFDRQREDFFEVRDEITALTVANLRVALPPETQAVTNITSDDPSLDVYVLYRRGVEASREPEGFYSLEGALAWFNMALEIDSDYAAAHAGKCSVYVDGYPVSDDPELIERAEASCARALELNPNLDVVHTALGELYSATGKYDQAENQYLDALHINPNSVKSLSGLGAIYLLQKRTGEAESRFVQAIGLHPGDWSAYNAYGKFLYRSGRYPEAAAQYEVVVALDANNMVGLSNLGTAYMLAGDFLAAEPVFQKTIDIKPGSRAYSNLGLLYYHLGMLVKSISAHRQAVKLAPNDHLALSNLGDAMWVNGQTEEAGEVFRKAEQLASRALQVNPNDPGYLMDLAWIRTMLGQKDEAARLIERARSQAPDDPYVHYIQGLMKLHSGDTDSALESFEIAARKGYSIQMLAADPQLTPIRDNPKFDKITGQAKKL